MKLDQPFTPQSIEGTTELKLDFTKLGKSIIPVAVQNALTNEVILIAYTNEIAFKETIARKKAIFWSTSRNKLWFKGEESGNTFTVQEIRINCEQNSLVYLVIPDKGNICHVTVGGEAKNCFYREVNMDTLELGFI
jgi:phosphoribosyl-AMP cyclohydrolase